MLARTNFFILAGLVVAVGATACGDDTTTGGEADGSTLADSGPDGAVVDATGEAGDSGISAEASDASDAVAKEGGDAGADADATVDGSGGPPINFTFASGALGWALDQDLATPPAVNLAAASPDSGAVLPTLKFASDAGAPVDAGDGGTSGALVLTATYSGSDQLVDAIVNFSPPIDLTAHTHVTAYVRLVSGHFPVSGGVTLHATDGSVTSHYFPGALVAGSTINLGGWVPLTLDVSPTTSSPFDLTHVIQIGVQFTSGQTSTSPVLDAGDAALADAGDAATDSLADSGSDSAADADSATDADSAADADSASDADSATDADSAADADSATDASGPFGPFVIEIADVLSN